MDSVCRGENSELAAPGNMRARWAKEKIKNKTHKDKMSNTDWKNKK